MSITSPNHDQDSYEDLHTTVLHEHAGQLQVRQTTTTQEEQAPATEIGTPT